MIDAGEVGIIINSKTGKSKGKLLETGYHFLKPSELTKIYSIASQMYMDEVFLKLKDNSIISLKYDYTFSPRKENLIQLDNLYGTGYADFYVASKIRQGFKQIAAESISNELDAQFLSKLLPIKMNGQIGPFTFSELIDLEDLNFYEITFIDVDRQIYISGLSREAEMLKSSDRFTRLFAIDNLFSQKSRSAMKLILDHWENETDTELKDYVLDKFQEKL